MLLEFGILVFDIGSMVLDDLNALATDKPICCILSKKKEHRTKWCVYKPVQYYNNLLGILDILSLNIIIMGD